MALSYLLDVRRCWFQTVFQLAGLSRPRHERARHMQQRNVLLVMSELPETVCSDRETEK